MLKSDKKTVRLLSNAASELGFVFTAPFVLVDTDGSEYEYIGHIENFGSKAGLLIGGDSCPESCQREREFNLSLFGPDCVESLDQIKEILADWGWFGDEGRRPVWLSSV